MVEYMPSEIATSFCCIKRVFVIFHKHASHPFIFEIFTFYAQIIKSVSFCSEIRKKTMSFSSQSLSIATCFLRSSIVASTFFKKIGFSYPVVVLDSFLANHTFYLSVCPVQNKVLVMPMQE